MNTDLPSAADVRAALQALTLRQLKRLAELSGASEPTLIKIRYAQTENPGVDTVAKFWPFVSEAAKFKDAATAAPAEAA